MLVACGFEVLGKDDEDAVYVRFTDAAGALGWDKLKPEFDDVFRQRGNKTPFVETYAPLMDRDARRALHAPEGLKAHGDIAVVLLGRRA